MAGLRIRFRGGGLRLIATKWISDFLPAGARFEIPDADAQVLILAEFARKDDGDTVQRPAAGITSKDQVAEPTAADAEPSTTGRRTYRRRDLTSET